MAWASSPENQLVASTLNAVTVAEDVTAARPSRYASLARTALEEALHWAEKDLAEKSVVVPLHG